MISISNDDPTRTGELTIVPLASGPFYGAYIDFFEGGKLIEKEQGQLSVLDPKSLRIDWTSFGAMGQGAGYSSVRMGTRNGILVEQYRMGDGVRKFLLQRLDSRVPKPANSSFTK